MNVVRLPSKDLIRHPLDDDQIVERVIGGDTALFEVLMRRHNQRLYRAALAILGDADEAEDVVQQAYINAYTHLHQFRSHARFSTWLTRIAVHEAYARLRKRRAEEPLDPEATEDAIPVLDPEKSMMNEELREVLEAEIVALPEAYRVVFVLREIEGLDTARTAEILGVSQAVVKTRLKRARGKLRTGLFERAGIRRSEVFAFLGKRCDGMVAAVFAEIEKIQIARRSPPAD